MIREALVRFWSQFGVPVYIGGHVPANASYPYITIEVVKGNAFTRTIITAYVWVKMNASRNFAEANAVRQQLCEAVANSIPTEGAKLRLNKGLLMLYRDNNFISDYDDANDDSVIGARIAYEISYLTK